MNKLASPMDGTSGHAWTVGHLASELAAHGLPGWRFTLIADAARAKYAEQRPLASARRHSALRGPGEAAARRTCCFERELGARRI